jgi:glucose-1-phosphatase
MEKNHKTVLAFDLGNVLFGFDYRKALKKIENRINVSIDHLFKELACNKFGLSFEKGLISSRQFYDYFKKSFKAEFDYQEFVLIWCDIFYPHENVIALTKKLKAAHECYVISNINELHFNFLQRGYPEVFDAFNGLILSYQVKAIKPEDEIYHCLRKMAGVAFRDIVYIDDRKDLIEAALLLNLKCIQYKNYEQLVAALEGYGIGCR